MRTLPLLPVLAAIAFNLWVLHPELANVRSVNDLAMHESMARWAAHRIQHGHSPFDGWYPYLSLGSPQFHLYSSFAHIVTGALLGGDGVRWTLYLLLSLWPVSVYGGCRLLGWDRWAAAGAAVAAPLVVSVTGYDAGWNSYVWRGYGLWPQLWGVWVLPLAWGLSWRAITRRAPADLLAVGLAAVALILTTALHFVAGYLAFVGLVPALLVAPSMLLGRLKRAVAIGLTAVAGLLWMLVPLLRDRPWTNFAGLDRVTVENGGYSAGKAIGWLLSGRVYDDGRFPVLTIGVAVGLLYCALRWRQEPRARGLVILWALNVLLFVDGHNLGPVLKVLPGSADLFLRFVIGVQLAGLLLFGVAAWWIGSLAVAWARYFIEGLTEAVAIAVCLLVLPLLLYPALHERTRYESEEAGFIATQQVADAGDGADLDEVLTHVGVGRIYAGTADNWGRGYQIGFIPVYQHLLEHDVDVLGYLLRTASLSTFVEPNFVEQNPAAYELFNVRYLLLPADRKPAVPATLVASKGRHRLYEVKTTGYLEAGDVSGSLAVGRKNIGPATTAFVLSAGAANGTFAALGYEGGRAEPSTIAEGQIPATPAGTISGPTQDIAAGTFAASVRMDHKGVVVLKSTFMGGGRWRATVDGRSRPVVPMAPDFPAVAVGPGQHRVRFEYVSYPNGAWFVLTVVAGGVAVLVDRRRRLRRERASTPSVR